MIVYGFSVSGLALFTMLTLNLGVRYDIETGFRERYNHWADFNPAAPNPYLTTAQVAESII